MLKIKERVNRWRKPGFGYKVLSGLALTALLVQTAWILLALFEPPLPYRIAPASHVPIDSAEFVRTLAALTEGTLHHANRIEVLSDGDSFYEGELAAMRAAKRFIHMERYLLGEGRVSRRMLATLVERAKAGVKVRVVFDAIGARVRDSIFDDLRRAGGRAAYYHPIRWYTWPRVNNRTHRELLVVDGEVAFIGGAGVADYWRYEDTGQPRWRDTMVRVEGSAVTGIQAVFAENWLESTGEVLFDPQYFPAARGNGPTTALVVSSSPSTGRSTQARVLIQALIAASRKYVHLNSPYFLPDDSLTNELVRAARERGVEVKIVLPGGQNDHPQIRHASRGLYGPLLEGGVQIYEYQPAMIHAKILIVDGIWTVAGTTNMDSRSFALNDEISAALLDARASLRFEEDFQRDVGRSRRITLEAWRNRPWLDRGAERIGALLQRQQ